MNVSRMNPLLIIGMMGVVFGGAVGEVDGQGVVAFESRGLFTFLTGGSATAALPNVGEISVGQQPFAVGSLSFSQGPNATKMFIGTGDPTTQWTSRTLAQDIHLVGNEDLNVDIAAPVFSFGFLFVEPEFDTPLDGTFIESTFEVTLRNGGAGGSVVDRFTFERGNDAQTFVGVAGWDAFDRVEIREIVGGGENEFFSQFFTGGVRNKIWIPQSGGSWDNTANWTGNTLPGPGNPVLIVPSTGGAITVSGPGGSGSIGSLQIDNLGGGETSFIVNPSAPLVVADAVTVGGTLSGSSTIENGGRVSDRFGFIALGPASNATVTVSGSSGTGVPSRWENTSTLIVGSGGTGVLNIDNGGEVTVGDSTDIGSKGRLNLVGGSLTTGAMRNQGILNHTGGTLTVVGGTFAPGLNAVKTYVIDAGDGPGLVLEGGKWDQPADDVTVGRASGGSGTLRITRGASVSTRAGVIGDQPGSSGSVLVTGVQEIPDELDVPSSWGYTTDLTIGGGGDGMLMITAGGVVTGGDTGGGDSGGVIGDQIDSVGMVTVSEAGSRWATTGAITAGRSGNGQMVIMDGGEVSSASGRVGDLPGSSGTVTISGTDSIWMTRGNISVGGDPVEDEGGAGAGGGDSFMTVNGGSGVLTVVSGGTLDVDGTSGLTVTESGTVHINHGGVVNIQNKTLIRPGGAVHLNDGTMVTDTLEINGTFDWPSGTLTVKKLFGDLTQDGGTLSLKSAADLVVTSGEYEWVSGTLHITGLTGAALGDSALLLPRVSVIKPGQTLEVVEDLAIGGGRVLIINEGGVVRAGSLSLNGGDIVAGTINLDQTHGLTGRGRVHGEIMGSDIATTITATGTLTLGDLSSLAGYDFPGNLSIGSHQVILLDLDLARLGENTELTVGGRLETINGAILEMGRTLTGSTAASGIGGAFTNHGTVDGPGDPGEFLTFDDPVRGSGLFNGNIEFLQGFTPLPLPSEASVIEADPSPVSVSNITFESMIERKTLEESVGKHVRFNGDVRVGESGVLRFFAAIPGTGSSHGDAAVDTRSTLMGSEIHPEGERGGDQHGVRITGIVVTGSAELSGTLDFVLDGVDFQEDDRGARFDLIVAGQIVGGFTRYSGDLFRLEGRDVALVPVLIDGGSDGGADRVTLVVTTPGDSNGDGRVGFDDFLVLERHFNHSGDWFDGDFTGDGKVGFDDFLLLQNNFGQDFIDGIVSARDPRQMSVITEFYRGLSIPEPGVGWLVGIGLIAFQRISRPSNPNRD